MPEKEELKYTSLTQKMTFSCTAGILLVSVMDWKAFRWCFRNIANHENRQTDIIAVHMNN